MTQYTLLGRKSWCLWCWYF